ncbi:hypothetical protein [Leptospira sarikeiensis]|uniref:hypothetical protein n=1 Tax=Leptospira sarikeiensis TaxID=2484943 RepID=UPI001438455A|nr:hypothetical protein [Leptospira sarikeiensis]
MATRLKQISSRISKSKIKNFENFARREIHRSSQREQSEKENKFYSWGMALEKIQKDYYKAARYLRRFQQIINPWREAEDQVMDYFYNLWYKLTHPWEEKEKLIIEEINSPKFKAGEIEDLNEFKIVYYQTWRYFNDSFTKTIKIERNKSEAPDGPFNRVKKQIKSELSDTDVLEGEWFIAFTRVRRRYSLKSSQPWKLAEGRIRDQLKTDLKQRDL